jgi:hypothetical protein
MTVKCPNCSLPLESENSSSPTTIVEAAEIPSDESFDPLPLIWQSECERAVFNVSKLLRLANRVPTSTPILEVLRTAPRTQEAIDQADEQFLFFRIVLEAKLINSNTKSLLSVISYFGEYFPKMEPARRARLEASIAGALIGYSMG